MPVKTHFLPILGVSALAVAHPVLNVLGQGATFFVAHGAEAADVIFFLLTIFLLPTLLLIAIAGCVALISVTAGKICVCVILGILAVFYSMTFLSGFSAVISIPLALVFGLTIGLTYFHFSRVRELLQWFGILSPLVVVSFLFFTPVSGFLISENIFEKSPDARKDASIVMLLFDELSLAAITTPDGQVDAGRLPNFARLAQISTWYSDTTTVATVTDQAVPAILTGLRPKEGNILPIYNEFSRNLFSLFAATHAINAMETTTKLCPAVVCSANSSSEVGKFDAVAMYSDIWIVWEHTVFPVDLAQRYLPSISMTWGNFDGKEEVYTRKPLRFSLQGFEEFVALIKSSEGPGVTFLHVGLPHNPWTYLPDGTTYNGKFVPADLFTKWREEKHLIDQVILRYSFQVEYADLLLGQALDALEQSGRMKDSMLIVVSDHGIAFKPGGQRRMPLASTLADIARVPLFIKYPGQLSGVRDHRKVETIDIFPTIADVAQLPLNESVDGQSLIGEDWQPAARSVVQVDNSIRDFEGSMNQKAASARIYEVIEPGLSALNATGFGSAKKHTGKPLPDTASFNKQIELRITSPYCFEHLDMERKFRPIHVLGVLEGASQGQEVMVGLNGVIAGSGTAFYDWKGGSPSVSIVLDPRKFIGGRNEVRAFSLTDQSVSEISVTCGKEGNDNLTGPD